MSDKIESILEQRRKETEEQAKSDRFYSILRAEGVNEAYLELRFRNGIVTFFNYKDLAWFNYDPENRCIDMDFMGFLVTVTGRGLAPELLQGIKTKRVAWISEANSEMQDNPDIVCFVADITVCPPEGFTNEPAA